MAIEIQQGDYRLNSNLVSIQVGQVAHAPSNSSYIAVDYNRWVESNLKEGADVITVGDVVDGRTSALSNNPLLPGDNSQTDEEWAGNYYNDDPFVVADEISIPWVFNSEAPQQFSVGQFTSYDGITYLILQAHTCYDPAQTPDKVAALYAQVHLPDEDWRQPISTTAYRLKMTVMHNGQRWTSTNDSNVWEPGVSGWINLTPPPPSNVWAAGIAYAIDNTVFYPTVDDTKYRCIQEHTSQAGWEPPNVASLWTEEDA